MRKELIEILFNSNYNGRAFIPMVNEDGQNVPASLKIHQYKKYGKIDFSNESRPNYALNVVLIKDPSEKLLGYLLCTNENSIPEEILKYVLDQDYGLLVIANENTELEIAFFMDIYSKNLSPFIKIYENDNVIPPHDPAYIVREMVMNNFPFVEC
jgi:hypothetical protein